MPFQRVPDSCEIIIRGTMGGQTIVNTYYGQMDGGYSLADVEALAAAVDGWVSDIWLDEMPGNYHYDDTTVRGLDAAIDLEAVAADGAGNGHLSASTLSNNASFAVSRRSGFTGRGARGRIYTPPPAPESLTDDNHVSSGHAAWLIAALNDLDAAITASGFVPIIVHRVAAGAPLAEAVVFTLIEWVVVDLVIDSMRRRLPGRGI